MRGLVSRRQLTTAYLIGLTIVCAFAMFDLVLVPAVNQTWDPIAFQTQRLAVVGPPWDIPILQSNPPVDLMSALTTFGWPVRIFSLQVNPKAGGGQPILPHTWTGPWDRIILHPAGFTIDLLFPLAFTVPSVVVGLVRHWGVSRRVSRGLCGYCAYNLTGNVSGRCSECGSPTDAKRLRQWMTWMESGVIPVVRLVRNLTVISLVIVAICLLMYGITLQRSHNWAHPLGMDVAAYFQAVIYGPTGLFVIFALVLCRRCVRRPPIGQSTRHRRFMAILCVLICFATSQLVRDVAAQIAFLN